MKKIYNKVILSSFLLMGFLSDAVQLQMEQKRIVMNMTIKKSKVA